jgi:hypothetical protein
MRQGRTASAAAGRKRKIEVVTISSLAIPLYNVDRHGHIMIPFQFEMVSKEEQAETTAFYQFLAESRQEFFERKP